MKHKFLSSLPTLMVHFVVQEASGSGYDSGNILSLLGEGMDMEWDYLLGLSVYCLALKGTML
jgi:hypothetical protein